MSHVASKPSTRSFHHFVLGRVRHGPGFVSDSDSLGLISCQKKFNYAVRSWSGLISTVFNPLGRLAGSAWQATLFMQSVQPPIGTNPWISPITLLLLIESTKPLDQSLVGENLENG